MRQFVVDYKRCPPQPQWMTRDRYEDLCRIYAMAEYSYTTFREKVNAINLAAHVINVCHKCGKVDINELSHWRTCDPQAEQYRRDNQEVYWK